MEIASSSVGTLLAFPIARRSKTLTTIVRTNEAALPDDGSRNLRMRPQQIPELSVRESEQVVRRLVGNAER
jgi:hypothetical protein